jgi:hypothetical protein
VIPMLVCRDVSGEIDFCKTYDSVPFPFQPKEEPR